MDGSEGSRVVRTPSRSACGRSSVNGYLDSGATSATPLSDGAPWHCPLTLHPASPITE